MKKPLIAVALTAMFLTGCSANAEEPERAKERTFNLEEGSVVLQDGREVTCVVYHGFKHGGLSCDWVGAR